jgi:hypothetical protein
MPTLYDYINRNEQMNQQNQQRTLAGVMQAMQLQQSMAEMKDRKRKQEALAQLKGQFNDPAARLLAQAGDLKGAVGRQFPEPQKKPEWLQRYETIGYTPEQIREAEERRIKGLKSPEAVEQAKDISRAGAAKITNNVGPTGIDYGNPPKDMAWARDPSGKVILQQDPTTGYARPVAVPVVGGEVDRKAASSAKADEQKQAQRARYGDIVVEDVDRAIKQIESGIVPRTGVGAVAADIPGTPQKDVAALLETVRANIGFDRLQALREASPTGGALGQVSDFENRLLQSTIGNLAQDQGKDQLIYNLRRAKNAYLDAVHGTPEHIRKLQKEGKIDAQTADELSRREPLTKAGGGNRKTINGVNYIQINGQWYQE